LTLIAGLSIFDSLEQTQPSPMSTPMYELYFLAPHDVDRKATKFSSLISQALNTSIVITVNQNSFEGLTFLPLVKDQMLNSFDATVRQYEIESHKKFKSG
jgi:hypothetical protein